MPPLSKTLLALLFSLGAIALHGQTARLDSLRSLLHSTAKPADRLTLMLAICEDHQSLNKDTLYEYASVARQLSRSTPDAIDNTLAELALANSYLRWGWIDSALASIEPELPKYSAANESTRDIYFKLARQKALCYGMRADYKNALQQLYQLVTDAETFRDTVAYCANMNTIASIAIARNEPHEALGWLFRANLLSNETPPQLHNAAAININLANCYFALNKGDSASFYIRKALPLARRAANLYTLATALRIQSAIALKNGNIPEAENALEQMIAVRERTNDSDIVLEENLQLIDFYLSTGQYDKAIAHCKKRLNRGNIYVEGEGEGEVLANNVQVRLPYYEALARAYKGAGMREDYQQTLEEIIAIKDSAYEASANQAIAEIQTKYEVQKKENTIIQQKMDITRKNYILYGSLLSSAMIAIIGWLLFQNYSRRQKRRMEKMQEEEQQRATAAIRQAEENERKRIAEDLHDNLGAYAASIYSNLDYLRIPDTDTGNRLAVEELRINARSIVSQLNDTIWALNKEALSMTAISDRIKLFLQRIAPSYPGVTMDVKEEIREDDALPPYQAFHLFQIIQEGVTNALKHSRATNITVGIHSESGWKLTIEDNGAGMKSVATAGMGGNGLLNMKNRAKKAGWAISWQSGSSGTSVIVSSTPN